MVGLIMRVYLTLRGIRGWLYAGELVRGIKYITSMETILTSYRERGQVAISL